MTRGIVMGMLVVAMACGGEGGGTPVAVLHSPAGAWHVVPVFSPDGARVAWWAPAEQDGAGWQLWVGNADLSNPVTLPVTAIVPELPVVWSPDGARIAAVSSARGLAGAIVVPSTGGTPDDLLWLAPGAGISIPIAWHPDGDRIAYYATAEGGTVRTFVHSLATGETRSLVPDETRPFLGYWSPDGNRIAYMVIDGARTTIWTAAADGSNHRALTDEGFECLCAGNEQPTLAGWSPDSREIVYESRRTGTGDLWVVAVDGGPPRQLTRDVRNDYGAAWSPDGRSIAFLSDRGRQTDLWVVSLEDGTERRVTDTEVEESAPRWRPGSNTVVATTRSQRSALWAHSLDDGSERRLTPDSLRINWFNLSRDGQHFNYIVRRGGNTHDLVVAPLDGTGAPRTLIAGGGSVETAWWSPDGTRIGFVSDRGGSPDIWVVDVADGTPRQLVNWSGFERLVGWNADGSAIYFASDRDTRLGDLWLAPLSGAEPVRVTSDGSVGPVILSRDGEEVFVGIITGESGRLAMSRVLPGGELENVWDASNVLGGVSSPSGDMVVLDAERPDGQGRQLMLVTMPGAERGGAPPRPILEPGALVGNWSPDGTRILYHMVRAGGSDLGVYTLATGEARILKATPEDEGGAEWTPDGRTVVFRRTQTEQRILTSDLTRLLGGGR